MIAITLALATLVVALCCISLAWELARTRRRLRKAESDLDECTRRTLARAKRRSEAAKRGWQTRQGKANAGGQRTSVAGTLDRPCSARDGGDK